MRLLGYLLSILGILIVMTGNIALSVQLLNALINLLSRLSQIALLYATNQALTLGGLVVLVIGLALILLSYRR